jgi:hypothetical protein
VASGASAAHVAGMFNVDFVFQQSFTNTGARGRRNLCALRAVFSVRQNFNNWHFDFLK